MANIHSTRGKKEKDGDILVEAPGHKSMKVFYNAGIIGSAGRFITGASGTQLESEKNSWKIKNFKQRGKFLWKTIWHLLKRLITRVSI